MGLKEELRAGKERICHGGWIKPRMLGRFALTNGRANREMARSSGPEAFPFDGASDLDPNLINPLIDGDVATLVQSLTKANLVAAPVESGDIASAKLVSEFLALAYGYDG